MDSEIKRILHLKNVVKIPLTRAEKKILAEWEKTQKKITIKKPRKKKVAKGYVEMTEMGDNKGNTIIEKKTLREPSKELEKNTKTTNQVKKEQKELNIVEDD